MSQQARIISLGGAYSIVVGSMLGIGIFLSPPEMARAVSSPIVFLAIWAAAGLIVLGGAVAYAELGARMPKAGGDYIFLREAMGPSVAFAAGWTLFAAIFSGSIAAVALAMCHYQIPALTGWDLQQAVFSLPWVGDVSRAQLMASVIVVALTGLNALGVKPAAWTQELTTLLPLALLFVLAIVALVLWGADASPAAVAPTEPLPLSLDGIVTAYMAAYFAYSGWNAVIYVAGEVEQPERNIPRSLIGGTLSVTALYMVMCAGFLAVLGMGGLASVGEAGSEVAGALSGSGARWAMSGLVLLCLVASLNGTVLGGGRVGYAMGLDRVLMQRAGRLSPRTGTPTFALWLQGLWAVALVLSNRFDQLLQAVSLAMVVVGSLTVACVFVMRRREGPPRGWAAWGYPWLPGLYLGSSALVVGVKVHGVFTDEGQSAAPLLGLAVVLAAFLAHRLLRMRRAVGAAP